MACDVGDGVGKAYGSANDTVGNVWHQVSQESTRIANEHDVKIEKNLAFVQLEKRKGLRTNMTTIKKKKTQRFQLEKKKVYILSAFFHFSCPPPPKSGDVHRIRHVHRSDDYGRKHGE